MVHAGEGEVSLVSTYLRFLRGVHSAPLRLLDVGSGPFSVLQYYVSEHVHVTAIDPLAHQYFPLPPRGKKMEREVRPINVAAEDIGKVFPDEYFHLIWSSNALDHVASPLHAIQQISHALNPDGIFILRVFPHEACRQNHQGLHRWNFHIHPDGMITEEDSQVNLLATSDLVALTSEEDFAILIHEGSETLSCLS